jgi:hypothetical protein
MPLFLFFNTHTIQIKIHNYTHITFPETQAGFEPGPPVPEAGEMSSVPRRQGPYVNVSKITTYRNAPFRANTTILLDCTR